jgi:hypothetical protein
VELAGRAFESSPHRLLVEIVLRLFRRTRARIQVALPEDSAEQPVQERWSDCPDPPCHEVMSFQFELKPDVQPALLPIRVVAQAEGETRELSLVVRSRVRG